MNYYVSNHPSGFLYRMNVSDVDEAGNGRNGIFRSTVHQPWLIVGKSSYNPSRKGNVIQIRMAERELELEKVPVSFFC